MTVNPAPTRAEPRPLQYFPAEVQQAYARAQFDRDPASVDAVVFAVLLDHLPDQSRAAAVADRDTAALGADLGLDSVATVELVFLLEDLFGIRINQVEIAGVRTVGDLHAFVRHKLAAAPIYSPHEAHENESPRRSSQPARPKPSAKAGPANEGGPTAA